MAQKRLVIDLGKILHLEIECSECHALAVFPLRLWEQDPQKQLGQFNLFECQWCQENPKNTESKTIRGIRKNSQPLIRGLINTLLSLRSPNAPIVRFILQDQSGDSN